MRYRLPEATYLAWLDCRGLGLGDPYEHFLRAGVALEPGEKFGAGGDGFVRLNIASSADLLEQAVVSHGRLPLHPAPAGDLGTRRGTWEAPRRWAAPSSVAASLDPSHRRFPRSAPHRPDRPARLVTRHVHRQEAGPQWWA